MQLSITLQKLAKCICVYTISEKRIEKNRLYVSGCVTCGVSYVYVFDSRRD